MINGDQSNQAATATSESRASTSCAHCGGFGFVENHTPIRHLSLCACRTRHGAMPAQH
jgi:ribosomal protein S14